MSWIKKKFNKLFKDDEYEEYEEQYEQYEEPPVEQPQAPVQQPAPKKAFRFPIIDDEDFEQTPKQKKVSRVQQSSLSEEERPLELPKHLQPTDHVYEVETQGIRDLLARRQKRVGRSHVLPNPLNERRKATVTKEEQQFLDVNPPREEKRTVNREFVNPLENKRRFVPTEVPSPVHGFQKPKSIDELLTEKKKERQETTEDASQTIKIIQHEKTVEIPKIVDDEPLIVVEPEPAEFMIEAVEEGSPVQIDPASYEPNDELILLDDESLVVEQPVTFESVQEESATVEETVPAPVQEQSFVELGVEEHVMTLEDEEPVVTLTPEVEASKPAPQLMVEPEPIEEPALALESELTEEPAPALEPKQTVKTVAKETTIIVESDDAIEALSDVQIQHLKIENSTIHIGQLNVEQAQQNEFIQQPKASVQQEVQQQVQPEAQQEVQQEQPLEALRPRATGSRLPFNVLMLSSDKQKLKAKEMLQQMPKLAMQQAAPAPNAPQATLQTPSVSVEQESVAVAVLEREEPMIEIEPVTEPIEQLATIETSVQPMSDQAPIQLAVEEQPLEKVSELASARPQVSIEQPVTMESAEQTAAPVEQAVVQPPPVQAVEPVTTAPQPPVQQAVVQPPSVQIVEEAPVASQPSEQQVIELEVEEPKYVQQYEKPSTELLIPPEEQTEDFVWMDEQGERLIKALSYFHIDAEIVSIVQGPAVTQFEITVAHGT